MCNDKAHFCATMRFIYIYWLTLSRARESRLRTRSSRIIVSLLCRVSRDESNCSFSFLPFLFFFLFFFNLDRSPMSSRINQVFDSVTYSLSSFRRVWWIYCNSLLKRDAYYNERARLRVSYGATILFALPSTRQRNIVKVSCVYPEVIIIVPIHLYYARSIAIKTIFFSFLTIRDFDTATPR